MPSSGIDEDSSRGRVAHGAPTHQGAFLQSDDHFRTLFELSPVAVYSIDASGVIQKFNRYAAELWGREPALGDTDERFVARSGCSCRMAASCPTTSVQWPPS